jgi:hypothetical protein
MLFAAGERGQEHARDDAIRHPQPLKPVAAYRRFVNG